ncbi:hypothetical protein K491DRAFT_605557 [Lophiostoma macrostomum CBS 122681]|uniref:Proteophosphoglycan 5 n=1 Tax=Lophiostoma macrostomum CBS 122681 TaxID=1314788 RepID=A0A6A6SZU7_9PLEO|nr:hypothetical protein K491DRAFT_605557 [Lophiostoma macrostomum CBS 122681]
MSSTQHTASPRGPRAKHQHSKSGTQVQPNTNGNGKQSQRRPKGNRTNNGVNGTPQKGGNAAYGSPGKTQANALDPSFTDSAVVSSEDVPIPTGPRYKKHTQSQPAVDRVFSPTSIAAAALTDSELPVKNPSATPVKQAAYAGPTFHASPAPSALPIPKFLSKSVPAKSFAEPPTPPEDGSESASPPTPSRASPSRAPIAVPERREFSPLNMLFKADAEEKARNANASPASLTLSNSPNQTPARHQLHHSKHNSQSSMTALFPIELDAESKPSHPSPPLASLSANRSITAPGKIPQVGDSAGRQNDPVVQELLNRLNQTKNPPTSTPPRTLNRVPSEPSSRHQTPSPHNDGRSPFRSASGPTTPAPPGPEQSSDLFYGNQANLSPLFKAAKTDSSKRNSGLRTEITADSPVLPQNGFAPISPPPRMDPNAVSRGYLAQALGGPLSPRRGSAPQVQPYGGPPNQRTRTPGKRSYQPRPDSYPHVNSSGAVKANAIPPAKTNPFIPSSVQAKKYSSPPTKAPDHSSLEDDLKRMLNVKVSGDTTSGVQ